MSHCGFSRPRTLFFNHHRTCARLAEQLTSLVAVEGAHLISLDVLTRTEARRMLAARLGSDRVAAEPAGHPDAGEVRAKLQRLDGRVAG
jgi:hypothetical protein